MLRLRVHKTSLWPYVSICYFCLVVGGSAGGDDSGDPGAQYVSQSRVVTYQKNLYCLKAVGYRQKNKTEFESVSLLPAVVSLEHHYLHFLICKM